VKRIGDDAASAGGMELVSARFQSFFMGGFECSTHRRRAGSKRLDVTAATAHDRMAEADYRLLGGLGIRTVRDGFRWHRIETRPGFYDWSSMEPLLAAARNTQTQVIWDLLHYGWPDDIDILSPQFVDRFARFCGEAIRHLRSEVPGRVFCCPINEMSFFAWAAGDVGVFYPFYLKRGEAVKLQLVRAAIAAVAAIKAVDPDACIIQIDPVIRVLPDPANRRTIRRAKLHEAAQYDAFDMMLGRHKKELGGHDGMIDVIGLNYYCHNQWYVNRGPLPWDGSDPNYEALEDLLQHHHQRYERPIFIAETGIEDDLRPTWLAHVGDGVRRAMARNVPVEGICLYPVMSYPGWDDDRHCHCGLIDYDPQSLERSVVPELEQELARQFRLFEDLKAPQRQAIA
jgi:polysaccharide biosynthesis protein PelF